MKVPVIHEAGLHELKTIVEHPVHSIGLHGPSGIGKTTLARWIITQITNDSNLAFESYPYFRLITPIQNNIGIDQVRELNKFMSLKTSGHHQIRRFVIIEQADSMTIEAQNALLKTLEEPPEDTMLILTYTHPRQLLSTITSRLQMITIKAPKKSAMATYFKAQPEHFEAMYNLSGNLPGLLDALLHQNQQHPLLEAVTQARTILQSSIFERLIRIDELSKDRNQAIELTQALIRMAEVSIRRAADNSDLSVLRRWQKILNAAYETQAALTVNGQTKLAMTNLMLQL